MERRPNTNRAKQILSHPHIRQKPVPTGRPTEQDSKTANIITQLRPEGRFRPDSKTVLHISLKIQHPTDRIEGKRPGKEGRVREGGIGKDGEG